jgi:two-component system NtrC family response regulator
MPDQPVVLIVDDEPEILETIQRRLRVEDIPAETCLDPREAIRRMRETLYPIAICDIKMPGMDGIRLLQEIKRANPLCNVIMMTGYSSMAHVVDCLGSGAVDYFVKPFQDISGIVEAVDEARRRIARWRQAMPLTLGRTDSHV